MTSVASESTIPSLEFCDAENPFVPRVGGGTRLVGVLIPPALVPLIPTWCTEVPSIWPPQLMGVVLPLVALTLLELSGVDAGTELVLRLLWFANPVIAFLFPLTTLVHFSINLS